MISSYVDVYKRQPIDKYREPCNTKVTLGSRFAENPLVLDTPITVSYTHLRYNCCTQRSNNELLENKGSFRT